MHNIIGTIPEIGKIVEIPNVHIHLYGKEARPGRKLGHVTLCADEETTVRAGSEKIELLLEQQ